MPNHQEEALAPLSQTAGMLVAVHGQTLAQFPVTEVQNSNLAIFSVLTRKKKMQKDRTILTLIMGGLLAVYP